MEINIDALKALELKLAEYTKANGAIAEYESANENIICAGCSANCNGTCNYMCGGNCGGTCTRTCSYTAK